MILTKKDIESIQTIGAVVICNTEEEYVDLINQFKTINPPLRSPILAKNLKTALHYSWDIFWVLPSVLVENSCIEGVPVHTNIFNQKKKYASIYWVEKPTWIKIKNDIVMTLLEEWEKLKNAIACLRS